MPSCIFSLICKKNLIVVMTIYVFIFYNNAKFSFMASMKYLWLVNVFNYFSIGQCNMVVILSSAWKHITAFVRNRNQHLKIIVIQSLQVIISLSSRWTFYESFSFPFYWTIADSFVARKNMLVFFFKLKIDIFIAMCNNIIDCLMEEDTWKESKALLVVSFTVGQTKACFLW